MRVLFLLGFFSFQSCDFLPDPQMRKVTILPESAKLGQRAFSPNPIRVPIAGRVVWFNADREKHSIFGDARSGPCAFRSDEINQRQSFSKSFFKRMTCNYYCGIHGRAAMRGKIIVE